MTERLCFHSLRFLNPRLENGTCYFLAAAPRVYPLSSVVEHFLPGGVELTAVLLQQPLLGQGDGLLGCPQDLHGTLELLRGLLGLDLSLRIRSTLTSKQGHKGQRWKINTKATEISLGTTKLCQYRGLRCCAHCQSHEICIMLDIFWTHSVFSERLHSVRRHHYHQYCELHNRNKVFLTEPLGI